MEESGGDRMCEQRSGKEEMISASDHFAPAVRSIGERAELRASKICNAKSRSARTSKAVRNDGEALALEEVKVVLRSGGLPHWIATAYPMHVFVIIETRV